MLGLLVLHIVAVVSWCGMLLYTLSLLSAGAKGRGAIPFPGEFFSLVRKLFILAATPAALLAIVMGTSLFLLGGAFGIWLILKLTAVSGLVICHALCGALIVHGERHPQANLAPPCLGLVVTAVLLIAAILWLVLSKPV